MLRRLSAVSVVIAFAASGCGGHAPGVRRSSPQTTAEEGTAYLTTLGGVLPINLADGRSEGLISVPGGASNIAVTKNGRMAYVVTGRGSGNVVTQVTPIDLAKRAVQPPLRLPGSAEGIALSPDDRMAFIPGGPLQFHLYLVSLPTGRLVRDIKLPYQASALNAGVAFARDGRTAYVAGYSGEHSGYVMTIDVTRMRVARVLPLDETAQGVFLGPDGHTLYVSLAHSWGTDPFEVAPIRLPSYQVERAFQVTPASSIAFSSDGRTAYLAGPTDQGSGLTSVDLRTDTVGSTVTLPSGGLDVAISPDGRTAYVTGGHVTPVNLATMKAGTPIAPPGMNGFYAIAISP